MKRKTVLVDLDNVVYPWAAVMADLVARAKGPNNPHQLSHRLNLLQRYQSWELWDDWDMTKGEFDWIWEEGIRNGAMWGTGEPLDGAVDGLWKLSDAEWHIHIVTHRLNKFRLHDQAVSNTVGWLADHRIPYRSLSFTEDKSSIMADAIIDDNPDNLVGHPAPVKILYPAPHNKAVNLTGVWKLTDTPWKDIVRILGEGYDTNTHELPGQTYLSVV